MSQANEGVDAAPATTSSQGFPTIAAGAIGGVFLTVSELGPLIEKWEDMPVAALGLHNYLAALTAIPVLVVGAHAAVVIGLAKLADRYLPRIATVLLLLSLAGLMGALWQDTVMHGDGIRAHEYYDYIRIAGWVGGPIAIALAVWVVGFFRWPPLWLRRAVALVAAIGGPVASHVWIPQQYKGFQGFVVLFCAGLVTWLLTPVMRGKRGTIIAWATIAVSLLAALLLPRWPSAQRYAQRYSHAPAALLTLPTTKSLELLPESVLDPDASFGDREVAEIRENLAAGAIAKKEPRGRNVLMVVLESTRADSWENPKIAKKFHADWKKHGTYFPRAVSQYPATPLAYGAMFTSQTPSVLTQTPKWAKTRLFDYLAPHYDHLIFARPNNRWFDHSAITDFFVPEGSRVRQHGHVRVGLSNVRTNLQRVKAGETFFAWVHIYEPHQPWLLREKFALDQDGAKLAKGEPAEKSKKGKKGKKSKKDKAAAHLSEVAFVDDYLGSFMQWFYEQPYADDTLVVVVADHGEGLGEIMDGGEFWGHHVHVQNFLSHVPAYFSGPGIPVNRTETEYTVQQLDIMPTMFDFMGEELPAQTYAQGQSVYSLMETKPKRDLVTEAFSIRGKDFFDFVADVREGKSTDLRAKFSEVSSEGKYPPKFALQRGDYKLIRDMMIGRSWVYDIASDPHETTDLVRENTEARDMLEERLEAWKARQSWIVKQLESSD